ncbi:hypothetical protein [Microbacterium sp.]|uniref:hypothetical protein n=1 Tax=Microbacterium sp. TaxID=51671 RepID=UPI003A873E51
MSTPRQRLTSAPVRSAAACMCASGGACSSFAPGHGVHLIQARLVAATPAEWVDVIVTAADPATGTILVHTLDGTPVELWSAAASLTVGEPVAYHPRYHAVSAGARIVNVAVIG